MEKRIQKNHMEAYFEGVKQAFFTKAEAYAPTQRNVTIREEVLDDAYYAELNAHYYLQTGHVLDERYALPTFDWGKYHALREESVRAAYAMWAAHEEEKRSFALSLAEELWNFEAFTSRYDELLNKEEIERYREHCKKVFIEEHIFLQPEWLLFSSAQWQGKAAFLFENPRVEFFCRVHTDALKLLPISVLQSKAFKKMLAKKHKYKIAA